MENEQPNNPLHGVRLDKIVAELYAAYGWEKLFDKTGIKAFENRPTVKSSLKMLRANQWARENIEKLYLKHLKNPTTRVKREITRQPKKNTED